MPFGDFTSLQDVAQKYPVSLEVDEFIVPRPLPVPEAFRAELDFYLRNIAVKVSEPAVCEWLIAPVLREVWKPYVDDLLLWSHVPLGVEAPLLGTPDYYFARRPARGFVREQPYVLVMQAKKDDFEGGWGQCLAAMLAAQQLNDRPTRGVFGCVSNGTVWEFGKLYDKRFVRNLRSWTIFDLPALFAAWNYVFAQAKEQALAPAA